MRVAVLGAGVTGLVAALRIGQAGHAVDVYERWPGLGGQAATVDVGGGVLLERYYHHWFTSDRHIIDLCEELGLGGDVEWRDSSMGFFAEGRVWPFTTPMDLLRFGALSRISRVRMGVAIMLLQRRHTEVEPFEGETARAWVQRAMGKECWVKVWGPLLRNKFGDRADDVSMAWLWSKLTVRRQMKGPEARREVLGYPGHSFEPVWTALRQRIEAAGGRIMIDRPAATIDRVDSRLLVTAAQSGAFRSGHDPRRFEPAGEPETYEKVLATVPSDVFAGLLTPALRDAVDPVFLERVGAAEYHTAVCLLLEIDRRFSPYYWTNIGDTTLPFVGLVEHTNFVEPERYGGRRFLYVANYVEPGDRLAGLDPDELIAAYEPGLRRVNPSFSRDWIRARWLFREPAAQPIVTVGYRARIPPLQSGVPGLLLANTTQIYPEDRGTNYSVRLGEQAAREVLAGVGAAA